MAETESNLKVKLFISLKKQFPYLHESDVRNVMKQFNNDTDKCLEELNKRPPNTVSSVNNNMVRLNLETKSVSPTVIHRSTKSSPPPVSSHSPELNSGSNVDFDQYITNVPNSNTIPHITCKTSEILPTTSPIQQIAVQHIQTPEPEASSYPKYDKYSMQQMYVGSSSSSYIGSPHNDKLHWPTRQKNTDPLVLPPPVTSPQHSTHANIFIEARQAPPNLNKGRSIEFDPQVGGMLHPVHSTGGHSPQPSHHGSQPTSPFSPQSMSSGSHSPQYINPKHSPSTQISQQFLPLNDSPFNYQIANMHGYSPEMSPYPIAINSVLHYRPPNNTYIHSVNPNVSGMPAQSEKLIYTIGTLPDDQAYIKALLNHQRQRYEKLSEDYENLLRKTKELSSEIEAIQRNNKEQNRPTPADLSKLRTEIPCLLKELDAHNNGQTPIGVLDPLEQQNFYKNMNTGQTGSLFAQESTPPPLPPRHPETPPIHPIQTQLMNDFEGEPWNCAACTFLNHPALEKCEQCEFPRNSKAP